jgi:hypothetical protein
VRAAGFHVNRRGGRPDLGYWAHGQLHGEHFRSFPGIVRTGASVRCPGPGRVHVLSRPPGGQLDTSLLYRRGLWQAAVGASFGRQPAIRGLPGISARSRRASTCCCRRSVSGRSDRKG